MGTNYYWHDKPCDHCKRYESIHVGKHSGGWSFLFRAWPHAVMNAEHPEWGYDPESPFGLPILTRADWRTVITTRPGTLWDEYGRQIEDPIEWIDSLTPPTPFEIREEDSVSSAYAYYTKRDPRDPEGFRTATGEFC